MTTDTLSPAEQRLADNVREQFGFELFAAQTKTFACRLADDTWLRSRPEWSAGLSFLATAGFAGLALYGCEHRDLVVAVGAYLAGLAAGIFGALETVRAVSAGHGGAP